MFRLDVALVGFLVFTLAAPLGGGYLAAWLVDSGESRAILAVFGGGTDGPAIAAALGAGVALGLTMRFTAGALLDSFVGAWPANQPLAIDPSWRLVNLNSRFASKAGDEIEEDGPLGLGAAVGWLGSAVGATLLAGLALSAWPAVDVGVIARVGAGTGSALDWLAAAFPVVARTLVASILGILAGAVWSIFGGPARRMETLEDEIEEDLESLSIVDAPGPDAAHPRSTP
jgi:hypothetical protein